MSDKPKRPRDANQLAKFIVNIATGESEEEQPKDPSRVERGRKGGMKGGKKRASRMSAEERSESAKRAAQARWSKAQ